MSTGTATASVSDEEVFLAYPEVRLNVRFYAGLLRHELLAARCADCGTWAAQQRPLCPRCWSTRVAATPVSGRGTVHTLTLLHQGPPAPDVDYATPWPLAAVELVEQPGLRFAATIVDCPPGPARHRTAGRADLDQPGGCALVRVPGTRRS